MWDGAQWHVLHKMLPKKTDTGTCIYHKLLIFQTVPTINYMLSINYNYSTFDKARSVFHVFSLFFLFYLMLQKAHIMCGPMLCLAPFARYNVAKSKTNHSTIG